MGKDINKTRNSHLHHTARLFSPWPQTNRQQQHIGLFGKHGEFETAMMDEDMTKTILQIEREQLSRIEQNRDEEDMEENSLPSQTQKLDLYSSSQNQQLFLSDNLLNSLSQADQDMAHLFTVPETQVALVTLEDVVAEKKGSSLSFQGGGASSLSVSNPQVIQVYNKIGEYLAKYQSGRLPKAFKIIPALCNWQGILLLTRPHLWTPQAMHEATKIFISNIKATQTKQFFQLVLLHYIRTNISKNHHQHLDTPLYFTLQKAMLKSPALFLKGFLFPLIIESGTCSIAEASAIARVIHQTKIPVLHSATALLKLSDVPFTLATGILVLAFLEKKQALPYRVVDALVIKYFSNQQHRGSQFALPNVWFHSFYLFVQSYGMDLVPVQKRKLLELVQSIQQHELSKFIEKAITIKTIDEHYTGEEEDDEKSDDTTYDQSEEDSDMAIDNVEEEEDQGFSI